MKHFLKRLAGFSLGSFVGALISVVQIPIMTRLMTSANYGIFTFFKNIVTQIPPFLCLGFDQAYVREYHTDHRKVHVFQQAVIVPFLVSAFLFLLSILFRHRLSQWFFGRPEDGYLVILGGLWCLMGVLERFIFLVVRMAERALDYSKIGIGIKAMVFVATVTILLSGNREYSGAVLGMTLGWLAADIYLLYRFRSFLDFRLFEKDRVLFGRMVRYGLPLVIGIALGAVLNTLDNLFLRSFASAEELGIYNAAAAIVNLFALVTNAFMNFWVPTALRWYEEDRAVKHYAFISDALLLVLTGIFFFLLLFSPLVPKILGEGYQNVDLILGLLSIRHIMRILSEISCLGIMFQRKSEYNMIISLMIFLSSLLVNFFLTPRLGFRGAAIANAVSFIVFYLSRTFFSRKCGFRIPQKKQIITVFLLFGTGIYYALNLPGRLPVLIVAFALELLVQSSTFTTMLEIFRGKGEWNFD